MKENSVLFIGNGINRISKNDVSWKDVIEKISNAYNIDINEIENKPFPLVYDEILLRSPFYDPTYIHNLRNFIALSLSEMTANHLHAKAIRKGINNILTTNYDHCLEKSIGSFDKDFSGNKVSEKKYSLYRKTKVKNTTAWHIHGDLSNPRSIQLGYNDYGGALTQIQNYLNKPEKRERSAKNNVKQSFRSWIDVFFRNKIHIVGLGLDFSEIDLWWVIIKKQYYLQRNRHRYSPGIPGDADTVFYFAYIGDISPQDTAKISILESIGVHVYKTELTGAWEYMEYYNDILNFL